MTKYKVVSRTKVNNNRIRKGYLSGYNLTYLIKILKLTKNPITFSILFEKNALKFKRSFLQYIKFSIKKGFIEKEKIDKQFVIYTLTKKGKKFLELID